MNDKSKKDNTKNMKLEPNDQVFIQEYIENGNIGVKAAQKAYGLTNYNSAAVTATKQLKKINIQQGIKEKADKAMGVIESLMLKSKREDIKLNAGKFIYEHGYGKPTQKTQLSSDPDNPVGIIILPAIKKPILPNIEEGQIT